MYIEKESDYTFGQLNELFSFKPTYTLLNIIILIYYY